MRICRYFMIVGFLLGGAMMGLASERYVIGVQLFRGAKNVGPAVQAAKVTISSFSDSLFFSTGTPSPADKASRDTALGIQSELASIFQMNHIDPVNSGEIVWDGQKEMVSESIFIDGKLYPIILYPKILPGQKVSFKVEISRYSDQNARSLSPELDEMAAKPETRIFTKVKRVESFWGEGESVLSTELVVLLDDNVVVGFPLNDQSYFLALRVKERPPNPLAPPMAGSPLKAEDIFSAGFLIPPKPLLQVMPDYPEACKKANIEGTVALLVGTDKKGKVQNIRVISPALPALERAAVEAIRQWIFEPVVSKGRTIKAIFYMMVDFRLHRENSSKSE